MYGQLHQTLKILLEQSSPVSQLPDVAMYYVESIHFAFAFQHHDKRGNGLFAASGFCPLGESGMWP